MLDFDLNRMTFESSLNCFFEEVCSKEVQLNDLQASLKQKCEENITIVDCHSSVIKESTKIISEINNIMKDFYQHFVDLKMEFAYVFYEKMFKIIIYGYKSLSEAYLTRFKGSKEQSQASCSEEKETSLKNVKNGYRKIEILDFAFKQIEKKDLILKSNLQSFESLIKLEKEAIQKIMPSKAVDRIREIEEEFTDLSHRIQDIFDYMFNIRHEEIRKFLFQLDKPQRIEKILCEQIKINLKQLIMQGIQKMLNNFIGDYKAKTIKKLKKSMDQKRNKSIAQPRFSASPNLFKSQPNFTGKNEAQILKQETLKLEIDKASLNAKITELENRIKKLQKENDLIEGLVRKKDVELDNIKIEMQRELRKKQEIIEELTKIKQQKVNSEQYKLAYSAPQLKNKTFTQSIHTQTPQTNHEEIPETAQKSKIKKNVMKKNSKIFENKVGGFEIAKNNFIRKSSLANILEYFKSVFDLPFNTNLIEKQFQKVNNAEEIEKIIRNRCDQPKKNQKEKAEREKIVKSNKFKKGKKNECKFERKSTKTIAIQTDFYSKTAATPYTEPTSRHYHSKFDHGSTKKSEKIKVTQTAWVKRRKQKTVQDFYQAQQKVDTSKDQQQKLKLNEFLNKASFEELSMSKVGQKHKVRTSNLGSYMKTFSRKQSENVRRGDEKNFM